MSKEVYRRARNVDGAGKGDANRVTERQRFAENFDAINWSRYHKFKFEKIDPPEHYRVKDGALVKWDPTKTS